MTLLPSQAPRKSSQGPDCTFEMIRILCSLKPRPRMRAFAYFYPESNKGSPTSDGPVICPSGNGHSEICSSARLWGSVPWRLCPVHLLLRVCEKGLNCWHVIGAAFLGPGVAAAKNSSFPYCAGGVEAQLLTWTAKHSFSLLRCLLFLVLLFLFLVSVCAYFSIGWNKPPRKILPLSCLARKPFLSTHRWVENLNATRQS